MSAFDVDLPQLRTIELGPYSLCGIDYQRKNDLVLRSGWSRTAVK